MSKQFYLVSMPLVVVRNFIVTGCNEAEACETLMRASMEFYSQGLYSERMVGPYSTFEGTPVRAIPLTEFVAEDPKSDPDMGVLS